MKLEVNQLRLSLTMYYSCMTSPTLNDYVLVEKQAFLWRWHWRCQWIFPIFPSSQFPRSRGGETESSNSLWNTFHFRPICGVPSVATAASWNQSSSYWWSPGRLCDALLWCFPCQHHQRHQHSSAFTHAKHTCAKPMSKNTHRHTHTPMHTYQPLTHPAVLLERQITLQVTLHKT